MQHVSRTVTTSQSPRAFLTELGLASIPHSGRSFLEHLFETESLLRSWGAPERVARAGLFHSVYGTEWFRRAAVPLADRPRVRAAIGDDAELLAYLFCSVNRASLVGVAARPGDQTVRAIDGRRLELADAQITDLLAIFWANELEQARRVHPLTGMYRERTCALLEATRPRLAEHVAAELDRFYFGETGETRRPGLAALLDTDDPKQLLAGWPNESFVRRGSIDRLAGLVDYGFDELVRMPKALTRAMFTGPEGRPRSITVAAGQERELYDAGLTIYFHALGSPRMTEWVDQLDAELGLVRGVTRVSAFASRRGLGLRPHYDMNDNFVCQARGVKRWRIATNTHVKNPTKNYFIGERLSPVHAVEAPKGMPDAMPPYEVCELTPGTVVFIPRGTWHDTETLESESLHFNIQTGYSTWRDALEYVLTRTDVLHDERLREPIVEMFDGDRLRAGIAAELKERIREMIERVAETDITITRQPFFRYVRGRRPLE